MGLLILLTPVVNLGQKVSTFFTTYLGILRQQMNPLQQNWEPSKIFTTKWPFTITLLWFNFAYFYGLIIQPYAATGTVTLKHLEVNEHLFTHQHVPQSIWLQIDIVYGIDWIFIELLFGLLSTWSGRIKERYQLTKSGRDVYIGGKCLPQSVSTSILRQSSQLMRASILTQLFSTISATGCVHVYFSLVNADRATVIAKLFFLVLYPSLIGCAFYTMFGVVSYVILASQYIRIRQRPMLIQLTKLNDRLAQVEHHQPPSQWDSCREKIWTQFYRLNASLIDSSSHLAEYSRYSGPILTIVFPYYITLQCYLLHAAISNDTVPLMYRQLFFIYCTEINACMFLLIKQCAAVSSYGAVFERLHRQFYTRYYVQLGWSESAGNARQLLRQLKTQTCARFHRFHSYSFTVWANVRITSQTYFLIISYISAFFMFSYRKSRY